VRVCSSGEAADRGSGDLGGYVESVLLVLAPRVGNTEGCETSWAFLCSSEQATQGYGLAWTPSHLQQFKVVETYPSGFVVHT